MGREEVLGCCQHFATNKVLIQAGSQTPEPGVWAPGLQEEARGPGRPHSMVLKLPGLWNVQSHPVSSAVGEIFG